MADQEIIHRPIADYPRGVSILDPNLPVVITHADECRCGECRVEMEADKKAKRA